jgi:hypothetical protein
MPEDTATEYGPDAQTEKDWEDLTDKQQNVVQALESEGRDSADSVIAETAGCSDGYVAYVRDNFPHIIRERTRTMTAAADGGQGQYNIVLGSDKAWRIIRILPEELSQDIWRQVRRQSNE